MAELAIVLVNYRGATDTVECVRSLMNSTYRDLTITIVENGSQDGSIEHLRAVCPQVELLVNEQNLGFAEGNNVGIRHVLRTDCRYVLLLNNDTVVQPDSLEELIGALNRQSDAGIVGGKILYFDKPNVIWFAGGRFNDRSSFGAHEGIGEIDSPSFSREKTCDYMTGCCLLARREVFDAIGLFGKEYFAYLEDAEFCVRARRKGFKVLYVPSSRVYHKVSSTSSWDSPMYLYFNLRNKLLYLRRNCVVTDWLPYFPRLCYFYLRQFLRVLLLRKGKDRLRACWYGLVDGLYGFTGQFGEGRVSMIGDRPGPARERRGSA
jgi:GT2 family glycosyltransferase